MLKTPLSFTVIGLGKVGRIFSTVFKEKCKLKLDYIIDKNTKDLESEFLGLKILDEIPLKIDSDLIIISTPDDTIEEIINLLNSTYTIKESVIFLHFSGATHIKSNKNIIAIHPMMSFTDYRSDLSRLNEHYFTLQSDRSGLTEIFIPIIQKITEKYIIINGEDKKFFHLASVIINNFSTALVKSSVEVIKQTGISEENSLKMLLPLLKDVFINLENNLDINKSLTGPIIRGDKKTINLHLELLTKSDLSDENKIYNIFFEYIKKKFLLLK